jgi:hypothetical protein
MKHHPLRATDLNAHVANLLQQYTGTAINDALNTKYGESMQVCAGFYKMQVCATKREREGNKKKCACKHTLREFPKLA